MEEEKLRRHCVHLRGADGGAANRWNAEAERANAPDVRDKDILAEMRESGVIAIWSGRTLVVW
jgi:hypothetical protein